MTNALPAPRRLDLDWIRIAAFGLLIAYHVGMYYVTWDWHIKSPHASEAIEPAMLALNPWRLSLLFFVSGCATAFLLGDTPRAGLAPIAWRRSIFLLVPLVFGMLVIVPPQSYFEVVDKLGFAQDYPAFWRRYLAGDPSFCDAKGCLRVPTWNHLWFVVYLWTYTMLAIVARAIPCSSRVAAWLRRVLADWRLWLLPCLMLALARAVLLPRFGSTHALLGDWYNHAQYLLVFGLGHVLARDDNAWTRIERWRWRTLLAAAVGYGALLGYVLSFSASHRPPEGLRIVMRADDALLQWSAILAVLGWGRRLLGRIGDSAARRYLGNAVFCWYLVHQTVIIVAAHELRRFDLAPLIEGLTLFLVTVAACALSYELLRRMPGVRVLFGIRDAAVSTRGRMGSQPRAAGPRPT